MQKKLFFILLGCGILFSCTKDFTGDSSTLPESSVPSDASQKLPVATNFDWNTMKSEQVVITTPSSSVYEVKNGQETLLAENLPIGTYTLTHTRSDAAFEIRMPAATQKANSISRVSSPKAVSYFPGEHIWAMMMIEDVFPNLGDLDMNDVIFNFRIQYELSQTGISGQSPHVEAIVLSLVPQAMGGTLYSQIGVALNFVQKESVNQIVKSTTGQILNTNMFEVSSKNGSENEKVVPLTDDLRALFIGAKTDKDIINTFNHLTPLKSTPITVRIELHSDNIRLDEVQITPDQNGNMLDLFVTLGERGREIHVKGHPATSKLNADLQKYSNYASKENWVWALILPNSIKYAKEGVPIFEAYPYFKDWVQGDLENTDEWSFAPSFDKIYFPK